jgi:hypothetical protein
MDAANPQIKLPDLFSTFKLGGIFDISTPQQQLTNLASPCERHLCTSSAIPAKSGGLAASLYISRLGTAVVAAAASRSVSHRLTSLGNRQALSRGCVAEDIAGDGQGRQVALELMLSWKRK